MDTLGSLLTDGLDLSNTVHSPENFDIFVQRNTSIRVFSVRPGTSYFTVTFHMESVQCFCG